MAYGKSIELFLVNGTADSLIIAELSNWNGKAIKIPRIADNVRKRSPWRGVQRYQSHRPRYRGCFGNADRKNSILVAAGKMSTQQMGAAFVDTVVISGGYLLGAHIGGVIGQAFGFELPVVGYLLGSLIGTSFCVIYNIGKKKLISFCVDMGFTCFGLVEHNYELPDEVLHELGVETIPIPQTQIERVDIPRTQTSTASIGKSEYETIDITVLRRGVIGVNKIGYVMN